MAELTPIPSAQRPAEPSYQPISGYAVAAAIVAGAFAALLIPIVIIAVTSRRTALSCELLVLPAIGIVLAAIARSNIRKSEGTRTGLRLAGVAWWVCALGGVGFGAYLYANQVILERESARFADRFTDDLKNGKLRHAFLYLVPPEERKRADPEDAEGFEAAYEPLGYQAYKSSDFVRLIARNPNAVEIDRIGIKDLGQENNGFKATAAYFIRCPEGVYQLQIRLQALEGRKGGTPQWRIPGQPAPNVALKVETLSRYGSLMTELEQEGDFVVRAWISHLNSGRFAAAHLQTVQTDARREIDADMNWLSFMGGCEAATLPLTPSNLPANRGVEWRNQLHCALVAGGLVMRVANENRGFEELYKTGFFQQDAAGSQPTSEKRDRLRDLWQAPQLMHSGDRPPSAGPPPERAQLSVLPDRILVVSPADMLYDARQFVNCRIGVECTNPAVIAALNTARAAGSGAAADGTVSLRTLPPRDWRVAWLRTNLEPQSVGAPAAGPPR